MPQLEIVGESSLHLTTALLIYESSRHPASPPIVTQHKVTNGMIQPGAPLDLSAFRKLIDKQGEVKKGAAPDWSWPFPRTLAEGRDWIAWWSPPGVQQVFTGAEGSTILRKCWVPALVWCAHRQNRNCFVWAYDGDAAPTPQTDMYRPKFATHIHPDSSICLGSAKLDDTTPASWERAFWASRFLSTLNLTSTKPYACKKVFEKRGPLAAVLSRQSSAD